MRHWCLRVNLFLCYRYINKRKEEHNLGVQQSQVIFLKEKFDFKKTKNIAKGKNLDKNKKEKDTLCCYYHLN